MEQDFKKQSIRKRDQSRVKKGWQIDARISDFIQKLRELNISHTDWDASTYCKIMDLLEINDKIIDSHELDELLLILALDPAKISDFDDNS